MQIAVITHPLDLRQRSLFGGRLPLSSPVYQLDAILPAARAKGLRWFYTDPDSRFRPADAAFLHVDMSVIPIACLDLAARYPRVINGRVIDIRKRLVSRNLVDRGSDWAGPVLVKSDLNSGGWPELLLARRQSRRDGQPRPGNRPADYQLFDHLSQVPAPVWTDPRLVVEKFLPERRGGSYVLRIWNFLGGHERCTWYAAPDAIVKAQGFTAFGPSEVPDFLRQERERLGFDYGKFDFAIGPEGPVLYDANRTPAYLTKRPDLMRTGGAAMAEALIALLAAADA